MPLDPTLVYGFRPTQNVGPNMGQAVQTAGQMVDLQNAQQQQKSQNALRGILGAPGAIDTNGQPTAATMQQVMAADPNAGMKLQQNALAMQQRQAQVQEYQTKRAEEIQGLIDPTRAAALKAYTDTDGPPEAKIAAGQKALNEGLDDLAKGGGLSDEEKSRLNRSFDPVRMGMMSDRWQTYQKQQAALRKDDRTEGRLDDEAAERRRHDLVTEGATKPAEIEVMVDPTKKDANGNPTPYSYNKVTREATTLDGKPYTPGGVAKVGAEAKPPPPGSQAAIRAAIDDDVKNDPAFKDKSAGERGQEVETRFRIAAGQLTDPSARHSMAEEIASYQLQPLSGFALTKPGGPETMAEVLKINPDYQGTRYPEISKAMTAFGSGKQGDTLRSLNVATQHLGVIDDAAEALKNGNVQTFNRIGNKIAEELGVAAPTTFDALKQIVGTEIEKAVAGGIGAVADRDRLMKSLDGANSPKQLEAVSQDFKKLMAGQAKGLKTQYEDATGFKSGPFAFDKKLMPATMKALGMVEAEGGKSQPSAGGNQPTERGNAPAFYTGDTPPAVHPDAKKAPDGNWYVKSGNKWAPVLAVEPSGPPAAGPTPAPAAKATQTPAADAPPPGAHAVPKAQANDPDGTTYNGGKLVKKGGFIVPAPAASGSAGNAGQGDPLAQARTAIAGGAPRDAVIKRLRDNGIDPAGL